MVGDEIAIWEGEGEEEEHNPNAGLAITGASDPKGGMQENAVVSHMEQIGDMIAAVDEGREPALNGQEARRAVEVILAIYESSQNGKVVELG